MADRLPLANAALRVSGLRPCTSNVVWRGEVSNLNSAILNSRGATQRARSLHAHALEREFRAGMQAVVAAATAIDAFYASVKLRIELPAELTTAWRRNGTARPTQVDEVLRRAFLFGAAHQRDLPITTGEIDKLRDRAVHLTAEATRPVLHPVINRLTEWRFDAFSFPIASQIVSGAMAVIVEALERRCAGTEPGVSREVSRRDVLCVFARAKGTRSAEFKLAIPERAIVSSSTDSSFW